jgi:hypothetical protein
MSSFRDQLPPGQKSKLIIVIDGASIFAQEWADLINVCVEHRLKVAMVRVPPSFPWIDDKGKEIEVSNSRDNKAIFFFEPYETPQS